MLDVRASFGVGTNGTHVSESTYRTGSATGAEGGPSRPATPPSGRHLAPPACVQRHHQAFSAFWAVPPCSWPRWGGLLWAQSVADEQAVSYFPRVMRHRSAASSLSCRRARLWYSEWIPSRARQRVPALLPRSGTAGGWPGWAPGVPERRSILRSTGTTVRTACSVPCGCWVMPAPAPVLARWRAGTAGSRPTPVSCRRSTARAWTPCCAIRRCLPRRRRP